MLIATICLYFPCGCDITSFPRDIPSPLIVTPAAGRKSLSDVHYAKQCGDGQCALHAVQLLDMGAGSSGCVCVTSLRLVITVEEIGRKMFDNHIS